MIFIVKYKMIEGKIYSESKKYYPLVKMISYIMYGILEYIHKIYENYSTLNTLNLTVMIFYRTYVLSIICK